MVTHPRVVGAEVTSVCREGRAESGAADEHRNVVCAVVAHHPRLNLALVYLHKKQIPHSANNMVLGPQQYCMHASAAKQMLLLSVLERNTQQREAVASGQRTGPASWWTEVSQNRALCNMIWMIDDKYLNHK